MAQYLGAELVECGAGRATVKMEVKNTHLNAYGMVHGGVLFFLADLAFGMAGNSEGNRAVAINATISYLKSKKTGILYAKAWEYTSNPRLASYTVQVIDEQGDRLALFQGMAYRKTHRS
ncbi:MAG: PaaI family thioesterase [Methanomicrobiales archaeon]|nr:PaaI family thioesterase [Methanomicrobiales archaeon]